MLIIDFHVRQMFGLDPINGNEKIWSKYAVLLRRGVF